MTGCDDKGRNDISCYIVWVFIDNTMLKSFSALFRNLLRYVYRPVPVKHGWLLKYDDVESCWGFPIDSAGNSKSIVAAMFCNIDTYDISIPEDNNIMVIYIDTYTIRSINRYHVNNTGLIIGRLISWLIDNNTVLSIQYS